MIFHKPTLKLFDLDLQNEMVPLSFEQSVVSNNKRLLYLDYLKLWLCKSYLDTLN